MSALMAFTVTSIGNGLRFPVNIEVVSIQAFLDPQKVIDIEADALDDKRTFIENRLNTFFKSPNFRRITGRYHRNRNFCEHVEHAMRKAPWVVHWDMPLEVGGEARWKNMSLMLASDDLLMRHRFACQLGPGSITIEKPCNSLSRPCADNQPLMPLKNDRCEVIELATPLDQYTWQQFREMGFWEIAKAIKPNSRVKTHSQSLLSDAESYEELLAAADNNRLSIKKLSSRKINNRSRSPR